MFGLGPFLKCSYSVTNTNKEQQAGSNCNSRNRARLGKYICLILEGIIAASLLEDRHCTEGISGPLDVHD